MSVCVIDLSSENEEEEEIVSTEQKNRALNHKLTNSTTVLTKNGHTALEKLTRNSNIQLTIDLDKNDDEVSSKNISLSKLQPSLKVTSSRHSDIKQLQQTTILSSNILVEEKNKKGKIQSKTNLTGTKVQNVLDKSENSTLSNKSFKNLVPLKVVEKEEIVVIDDDDDDNNDEVIILTPQRKEPLNSFGSSQKSNNIKIDLTHENNRSCLSEKIQKNSELQDPLAIDPSSVPALNKESPTFFSVPIKVSVLSPITLKSSNFKTTEEYKVTIIQHDNENKLTPDENSKNTNDNSKSVRTLREPRREQQCAAREKNPLHVELKKNKITPQQVLQSNMQPKVVVSKINFIQNPGSSGQTSSKTSSPSLKKEMPSKESKETVMEKHVLQEMFDKLVKYSCKIFRDEKLGTKLWKYFNDASDSTMKSRDFLTSMETALKSSEKIQNPTLDDEIIISIHLKEVMRVLKRQPERTHKMLRKLNKMLQIINERIHKLEQMEVTSDDDSDNIYCLLDKYRTRATKIYSKICELEGKAAHAGRPTLQKFRYCGKSGYSKIELALERYYNKTQQFPDFHEVKKLIELTVEKEKLQILPVEIHNLAQSIFLEFGDKLQRRRKCDDYSMIVSYLEDGSKDPALDDEELYRKLEDNKKNSVKERDVLASFMKKQIELKTAGEIKSDGEEEGLANSANESENEEGDKKKDQVHFSDTEEELFNEDVAEATPVPKRKLSMSENNKTPLVSDKKMKTDQQVVRNKIS